MQGFKWMLVLLGHLVNSTSASWAGVRMLGGIYHMFIREAALTPRTPGTSELAALEGKLASPQCIKGTHQSPQSAN